MTTPDTPPTRNRRTNSWWEPTYRPGLGESFSYGDWSLPEQAAYQKVLTADRLKNALEAGICRTKFTDIRFKDCDFFGHFDQIDRVLIFERCQFEGCDFGLSTWDRVKFTKCRFVRCSFSQSNWMRSEFRQCKWSSIGLSGNETVLDRVFIENPEEFVRSAYTNLDPAVLERKRVDPKFQRARLEETKATVARNIYNSHRLVGDDETFHKACKIYLIQSSISRIQDRTYTLKNTNTPPLRRVKAFLSLAAADVEYGLVLLFGNLNNWGGSISKPLFYLVVAFIVFSGLYFALCGFDVGTSLGKSFDITTIAGYGRAVSANDKGLFLYIAWGNLVLAILFYTVFFATAVAKISRTR